MPSERVQRRIDRLLDEAEEAADGKDWRQVAECARAVLVADAGNEDASTFLAMSEKMGVADAADAHVAMQEPAAAAAAPVVDGEATAEAPTSFAGGRYEVKRFLGEGGKKRVYLAHDTTLDRDVAFALIKTEGFDDISRQRITREAQAMGRLGDHPHIVSIYDLGTENGQPFMVLPLMPGGDVEGLLAKAATTGDVGAQHAAPLPLEQAIDIARAVCDGLSFAHSRGIIHRDLKPGNVWLAEDGTAKIGDFGLAVVSDRSRLTIEGMMVGTVSYMPPEQATGGEITAKACVT